MSEHGKTPLPISRDRQIDRLWPIAAVVLALAVSALTVGRLWYFSNPYPPGLDGAQWLSYGRALFGGAGRSAESTYAPVIPVLAYGLSLVAGPVLGVRLLATAMLFLLIAAVWLLSVRVLGVTWGALTAALVVPCTAMAEPFFYGGYPQQTSLAFGLLGIAALVSAGRARKLNEATRALALSATAFLFASASHLLYGPLLLVAGGLVALVVSLGHRDRRRLLLRTFASLIPAAAMSVFIALAFRDHGYSAPLAVSQRTLQDSWGYATRESPVLWAAIVISGFATSTIVVIKNAANRHTRFSRVDVPDAAAVGLALSAPSAVLVIVSGQPRLAPPLLLGGAILAAFALLRVSRVWVRALPFALATWCFVTLWLAGATTGVTREFASFYQVLDPSLVAATRSIPPTNAGSIAVAADRRGWPIGWWIEALQERPVFTGSDRQWLAFPDERTRASAVAELLASPDVPSLEERAADICVEYLLMRKWDWIGWERWIDSPTNPPVIVYDDNETIVLELISVSP